MRGERLELLSAAELLARTECVQQFRQLADRLSIGLGWHYLLDLCWASQELDLKLGMCIIDAGAGVGVMQWWLADQGVDVISVDRTSRRDLDIRFRQDYNAKGVREQDLSPVPQPSLRRFLPSRSPKQWHRYPTKLGASLKRLMRPDNLRKDDKGTVSIYNQDLITMPDVPDNSIDAVVSISALEHNSPRELEACVHELMRVLKPGGKLVATLTATKGKDWFHEPSKGWCYSQESLKRLFDLCPEYISNYDRYDELFEELRGSHELRANLAEFYFRSGSNGMPWGIWDPKYIPVGVVKVKACQCPEVSRC